MKMNRCKLVDVATASAEAAAAQERARERHRIKTRVPVGFSAICAVFFCLLMICVGGVV